LNGGRYGKYLQTKSTIWNYQPHCQGLGELNKIESDYDWNFDKKLIKACN